MEKRVPVKTLYLLLVIAVGLVVLGVGSTYALFTASAEISNPIVLSSNLSYNSDLIETVSVEVPAGKTISTTLNITNSTSGSLNYTTWYINNGLDIELGISDGAPTGSLTGNSSTSVVIDIRNNEENSVVVLLGISSNSGSVILGSGMKAVPNEKLSDIILEGAALYITNLYLTSSQTQITQANSGDQYYYATSVGLMNDGLEGNGNVRYYGADPDNYIYFNCSDYVNQNDGTCEKWRIIGVFDGKIKIVRSEILGQFAWDYTSAYEYDHIWHDSTLMTLLNNGYYNNMDGVVSYYYTSSTMTSNFNSDGTGIKNTITRNLISDSTWYLGDGGTASGSYPSVIYAGERGNDVGANIEETWTGKVALMYPSDYGYAADLSLCGNLLNDYETSECTSNNWLFSGTKEWFISPTPNSNNTNVWSVGEDGAMAHNVYPRGRRNVRPTLYLNSDISILEGDGSSDSPYRLDIS